MLDAIDTGAVELRTIATHELLEEHHDATNSQPLKAGPCCQE